MGSKNKTIGLRCPVCGFTTNSYSVLAEHMATTPNLPGPHMDWIESKGLNMAEYSDAEQSSRQFKEALQRVVSRECVIEE